MNLRHIVALAKLHSCRISMDGFSAAGNTKALREYAAKEALLLAQIRPTGTEKHIDEDKIEEVAC